MTDDERMTKHGWVIRRRLSFVIVIDSNFVIRISFVIRHLPVSDVALPPMRICSSCNTSTHAFICDFAKATAGDAAARRGAFSARVTPAVHFRAAVSQHAETRASPSSHVLRDPHQTQLPGLACPGGFLSSCYRRVDSRLCRAQRWHVEFDPARSATCALHQFRTGNAVPDRQDRDRRVGAKVLELYENLKHERRQLPAKVDRYLSELRDLEMLADLMASTFVNDPLRRQRVLEERLLNQRLRFLITYLRDEIGNAAA